MSPRAKTPFWIQCIISNLWLEKSWNPVTRDYKSTTATQIHGDLRALFDRYQGSFGTAKPPSLRTVQEIIANLGPRLTAVTKQTEVQPFSNDWPKDPDDTAYLLALERIGNSELRMTKEEITVALELKGAFEWPTAFNENGYEREKWSLADPWGGRQEQPGEWAVISELALLRELQGDKLIHGATPQLSDAFEQVNRILISRPWRSPDALGMAEPDIFYQKKYWSPILWSEGVPNHEHYLRQLLNSLDWFTFDRHSTVEDKGAHMVRVVQCFRDVFLSIKNMDQPNHLLAAYKHHSYYDIMSNWGADYGTAYGESLGFPMAVSDQLRYSLDCIHLADSMITHWFNHYEVVVDGVHTFAEFLTDSNLDASEAANWPDQVFQDLRCHMDGDWQNPEDPAPYYPPQTYEEEKIEMVDGELTREIQLKEVTDCGEGNSCPYLWYSHPGFKCPTCGYREFIGWNDLSLRLIAN